MASVFKNAFLYVGDEYNDVYICPAGTTAIVLHCQVTNIGASNHDLSMEWTDFSSGMLVSLASEIVVPENAAYEPIGGKLVLEAGDKISAKTDDPSEPLEVSLSVLEIS